MKSKKLFVDEMGQINLTGGQPIKHHEPPQFVHFLQMVSAAPDELEMFKNARVA
jgi:hypothetical protein